MSLTPLGQTEEIRIHVVSIPLSPYVMVQACRLTVGHVWGIRHGKFSISAVDSSTRATRVIFRALCGFFSKYILGVEAGCVT